ncbi:MAG: HD domain-containing protein [Armatimonadetes bacterium]|nr:HD domain-containing protein [Armatimonadota bacterium]
MSSDETLVAAARDFAVGRHNHSGCTYEGESYETHLQMVVDNALAWQHLLPDDGTRAVVTAAAWCHDVLEDTPTSYHDLCEVVGEAVADIVYDVTNELGKTRAERTARTYPKIAANRLAVFLKLCDRLANQRVSVEVRHRMAEVYRGEYPGFKQALYRPEHGFGPLWAELDRWHA